MIRSYSFKKEGAAISSTNDLANTKIVWTEVVSPTQNDLKEIAAKAKLPYDELKDSLKKDVRPKVAELDNYSQIIVRTPTSDSNLVHTTPIAIFISKNKNNVITLSPKVVSPILKVENLVKAKKVHLYDKGVGFFTYTLINEILDEFFLILDKIEADINQLEDYVVSKPDKVTVKKIFNVKKTLILFHRALTANREVITAIEKQYLSHIDKRNVKRFSSLYNDITQLIETEGTYRDIMTGTMEIYLSSVSNNLNHAMKTLTVIASFILIPTLISGIYGMNFTSSPFNMPELTWKYGYFFALGLMGFSIFSMYIYFKRKGWL
jgi:magnesium transporter